LLDPYTAVTQLDHHGSPIHRLDETAAECLEHGKRCGDDGAGDGL